MSLFKIGITILLNNVLLFQYSRLCYAQALYMFFIYLIVRIFIKITKFNTRTKFKEKRISLKLKKKEEENKKKIFQNIYKKKEVKRRRYKLKKNIEK